jgi:hydroxyethylthiazole kinase-like uncharacterized protein yjeF
MKLISVGQMRAIEKEANANGLTYEAMMENAGHNIAKEVLSLAYSVEDEEDIQVLGFVGPGNNGGDTLVVLKHLAEKGWKARAYLVNRKKTNDPLIKNLETAGGEIHTGETDTDYHRLTTFLENADIVLDGILGTGCKLPLKQEIRSVMAVIKSTLENMTWRPMVVGVDCPSGIDCDSGEIAQEAFRVDATITLAAVKKGFFKLPAYQLIGELRVADIGIDPNLSAWKSIKDEVIDADLASSLLPHRSDAAHKGDFGNALVIAGSMNYTGAALLAGKAAGRIGAGLVTMAVPAPLHSILAGQFLEGVWVLLPHEMGVISSNAKDILARNLEQATALLVGPGLGLEETTREFIQNLVSGAASEKKPGHMGFIQKAEGKVEKQAQQSAPMIIDADGLKLLSKIPGWEAKLPPESILTPHPGEMAVLTGMAVAEIQNTRLETARNYSIKWGHIVVLKGAFTVVASPDGRTTTSPIATSALAHAGTGDVLAGIITGLRAQGVPAYDAARLGAWIHAEAGLIAATSHGNTVSVLAGDVLESIKDVIAELV